MSLLKRHARHFAVRPVRPDDAVFIVMDEQRVRDGVEGDLPFFFCAGAVVQFPLQLFLALAQRLVDAQQFPLRLFARGDIGHQAVVGDQVLLRIAMGHRGVLYPADAAVLVDYAVLEREGSFAGKHRIGHIQDGLPVVFVDHPVPQERVSRILLGRIAGHRDAAGAVQRRHGSSVLDPDSIHVIRDRLKESPVARLALREGAFRHPVFDSRR